MAKGRLSFSCCRSSLIRAQWLTKLEKNPRQRLDDRRCRLHIIHDSTIEGNLRRHRMVDASLRRSLTFKSISRAFPSPPDPKHVETCWKLETLLEGYRSRRSKDFEGNKCEHIENGTLITWEEISIDFIESLREEGSLWVQNTLGLCFCFCVCVCLCLYFIYFISYRSYKSYIMLLQNLSCVYRDLWYLCLCFSSSQDASRLLGSSWMRRLRSPLASSKRLSREPGILEPSGTCQESQESSCFDFSSKSLFESILSFLCGLFAALVVRVHKFNLVFLLKLQAFLSVLQNNFSRTE